MQDEGSHKEQAYDEVRRRMQQAAAVGSPSIVASPVPDARNVDIGQAAARYREIVAIAQQAHHPDALIRFIFTAVALDLAE